MGGEDSHRSVLITCQTDVVCGLSSTWSCAFSCPLPQYMRWKPYTFICSQQKQRKDGNPNLVRPWRFRQGFKIKPPVLHQAWKATTTSVTAEVLPRVSNEIPRYTGWRRGKRLGSARVCLNKHTLHLAARVNLRCLLFAVPSKMNCLC